MNDRTTPDRRQFLTGTNPDIPSPVDPCEPGLESMIGPAELRSADSAPLMTYSINAMGCQFQVISTSKGQRGLVPSIHDGFELILQLEQQLTTYDSNSELERLNQCGALRPTSVSRNLFELLGSAIALSETTNGAFDITAAPLSRLWNFHQRAGRMPDTDSIEEVVRQVGFRNLRLDPQGQTVAFEIEHLRIDLGGIGKGYALDELTQLFVERGGADFVIHGGQSSIVARGHRDETNGELTPWRIGISHPLLPAKRLATIALHNEALGTSGSGRQSFIHNGRRYGHIIDPRSGWPADHRLSVTVIASTAATADAMATALFVLGDEELERWSDKNSGTGILALKQADPTGQLVADVFNFGTRNIDWLDDSVTICNR